MTEAIAVETVEFIVSHKVTKESPEIARDTLEEIRLLAITEASSFELYETLKEKLERSPHLRSA